MHAVTITKTLGGEGERWTNNYGHGRLTCYAAKTTALQWQTDCFMRTASCEAVRCNKFWNKKIHG